MATISKSVVQKVDDFIAHFHDSTDADGNERTDGDVLDDAYALLKIIQDECSRTKVKFPVSFLTRQDFDDAGYDIAGITDDDIEKVASRMDKYYSEGYCNSFTEDLKTAADYIGLKEKED